MLPTEMVPCPFCGEARTKMERLNTACYFLECQQCGAKGPEALTYEEAVAAWNTRALPPPAETGDVLRVITVDNAFRLFDIYVRRLMTEGHFDLSRGDEDRAAFADCVNDASLEAIASRLSSAGDDELVARLIRDARYAEQFSKAVDFALAHAIEEAGEFIAEMRDLRGALNRLGAALREERRKRDDFERTVSSRQGAERDGGAGG